MQLLKDMSDMLCCFFKILGLFCEHVIFLRHRIVPKSHFCRMSFNGNLEHNLP